MSEQQDGLAEFASWLRERRMARENRIPYFEQWVRRFLGFARTRPRESWHDTLRVFLEDLEQGGAPDWQVRQAAEAVSLYHGQFLETAGDGRIEGGPNTGSPPSPDENPPVDSGFSQSTRIWNCRTSGKLFTLPQKQ